jgi:hypothetical protein
MSGRVSPRSRSSATRRRRHGSGLGPLPGPPITQPSASSGRASMPTAAAYSHA